MGLFPIRSVKAQKFLIFQSRSPCYFTAFLVQIRVVDEQVYAFESYAIKVNGGVENVTLSFEMLKLRK